MLTAPTWEVEPREWRRCLEVNLRGPMLCSRAVLPGMIARKSGGIVNVARGAGTFAIPHLGAYVTSKTALTRFTEVLAAKVAEHGVMVFAIEPGTVRTDIAEYALESRAGRRWMPWFRDVFEQGRDMPPHHAARLVNLLASGMTDALSAQFLTVHDDVLGLAEQIAGERSDDFRRYPARAAMISGLYATTSRDLPGGELPDDPRHSRGRAVQALPVPLLDAVEDHVDGLRMSPPGMALKRPRTKPGKR